MRYGVSAILAMVLSLSLVPVVAAQSDFSYPKDYDLLVGKWVWRNRHCFDGPAVLVIDKVEKNQDGTANLKGTYRCDRSETTVATKAQMKDDVIAVPLNFDAWQVKMELILAKDWDVLSLYTKEGARRKDNPTAWFRDHYMDVTFTKVSSSPK